jgi:hypothetical protein
MRSDLVFRARFLRLNKYYYALWDSGQEHRLGTSLIAAQAVPKIQLDCKKINLLSDKA